MTSISFFNLIIESFSIIIIQVTDEVIAANEVQWRSFTLRGNLYDEAILVASMMTCSSDDDVVEMIGIAVVVAG